VSARNVRRILLHSGEEVRVQAGLDGSSVRLLLVDRAYTLRGRYVLREDSALPEQWDRAYAWAYRQVSREINP
jgi:hypothetical protein